MHIGSHLELLLDEHLIDTFQGDASLHLQHPIPRELVITHDKPWEGNTSGYHTIFEDDGRFRMYYRGSQRDLAAEKNGHPSVTCYAESTDGIHWTKPNLGLCEYEGSTKNNIVWAGRGPDDRVGVHNFAPFKDTHPDCDPEALYKAVGSGRSLVEGEEYSGLLPFRSPDGIHWSCMNESPVITDGAFDSQNLAFYDTERGEYRAYYRDFRDKVRAIKTATSQDFLDWKPKGWLEYPGAPIEHLYTNQIMPYYRAPHIFIGFPTRFVPERESVTEGLFMSSRDGATFKRWGEALIRPGLNPARWGNRSNYIWQGAIETQSDIPNAPKELSLYSIEGYYEGTSNCVRRFTYRVDGFVSVHAPLAGGELITKPLIFKGNQLVLNYSTSAAGVLRVEIRDAEGNPINGYSLTDNDEIYGDAIEQVVRWQNRSDVSALAGKPVRLRFVLSDADLFALRFS